MKKLILILITLIFSLGCESRLQDDLTAEYLPSAMVGADGVVFVVDYKNTITTNSSDPIFQKMVKEFPTQPCQWQVLYSIGYGVVRVDKLISEIELEMIDWVSINNQLTTEYYKVVSSQTLSSAAKAVLPGRTLEKGWKWAVISFNAYEIGVAYLQVPNSSYYQVSFVKFTKWK